MTDLEQAEVTGSEDDDFILRKHIMQNFLLKDKVKALEAKVADMGDKREVASPKSLTEREKWLMKEMFKVGFDYDMELPSTIDKAMDRFLSLTVADNGGTVENLLAFDAPSKED